MGAYSSFVMLGLAHHYIVQLAAYNVGYKSRFEYYALLGDDIVIADKAVAKAYLVIMQDLGLDINMSKSLVSDDTFEFAKRLIRTDGEFSPIGPANLLSALRA